MGRIRTHDVKKVSRELIERYGERFTADFTANKAAIDELKLTSSKRTRNKVAGYVSRLAKRRSA